MSSDSLSVLVIDDSPQIRRLLKTGLSSMRFDVIEADTGADGLQKLRDESVDLVVLDLGLPDQPGLSVLETIRLGSQIPTIILSVQDNETSKISAFERGADDYVTKPFSMPELIARMKVALRHRLQVSGKPPTLRYGDLEIDLVDRRVSAAKETIRLSRTEFGLLRLLAEHVGKTLTHDYLVEKIWGAHKSNGIQCLRAYMRSLRQKLGDTGGSERLILTESGVGYRLRPP